MPELIVALDLQDAPSAVALLDELPEGCPVKVGSVLFTSTGASFVRALVQDGHPVFLDLKWHDIPNTVANAVRAAADLGVEMATVHALGGEAMLAAAVEAAGPMKLVAVTVLTSHEAGDFGRIVGRRVEETEPEVVRLARSAIDVGIHGVVCSPQEVAAVKPEVAGGRIVVPGIRRSGEDHGDQARVATPAAAVAAGATHLVVGRPIIAAADPAAAWAEFRAMG